MVCFSLENLGELCGMVDEKVDQLELLLGMVVALVGGRTRDEQRTLLKIADQLMRLGSHGPGWNATSWITAVFDTWDEVEDVDEPVSYDDRVRLSEEMLRDYRNCVA